MKQLHPLINPSSTHYHDKDGTNNIQKLEEKYSISKMIGFCEISKDKYLFRLDKKGQKASDEEKIITYENYLTVLNDIIRFNSDFRNFSVKNAMNAVGKSYRYS